MTLNGKELSFILDTGAKNTILFGGISADSVTLNEQVKTKLYGIGKDIAIDAIISKNNRIKIKDIYGYNQTIYVLLGKKFDLSLKMGRPIHGIIGWEIFKNFVTDINFRSRIIRFNNPEKYHPPKPEKFRRFSLDFYKDKPYLSTEITLSDSLSFNTNLLIDTGCSDALWLFENPAISLVPQRNFFRDHLGEGLSGNVEGKRTKITAFKIGNFVFPNITAAFIDSTSTKNARKNPSRNGSIGSRLLERFHIILDYPNQKIYLKKAKDFNKEFRYNRAGIGVAYSKDAKVLYAKETPKLVVSERDRSLNVQELFEINYQYELKRLFEIYYIRPGSPADKAGLMVGDLLYSINGKPAFNYSLRDITNLFYDEVGKNLKIEIRRHNMPYIYFIQLKDPL